MKEWHVALNGQAQGPFPEEALRAMALDGTLSPDSLVWNEAPENAAKGWQKASDTEIAAILPPVSQATASQAETPGQNLNAQPAPRPEPATSAASQAPAYSVPPYSSARPVENAPAQSAWPPL